MSSPAVSHALHIHIQKPTASLLVGQAVVQRIILTAQASRLLICLQSSIPLLFVLLLSRLSPGMCKGV